MSSKLQSDVTCALVAPSGECLRGEGLVRLIGAFRFSVCSLAAAAGPIIVC